MRRGTSRRAMCSPRGISCGCARPGRTVAADRRSDGARRCECRRADPSRERTLMSEALDALRKNLPQAKAGSWYSIKNQVGEKAVVRIYDEISYWGVSAADFAADLAEITAA